jgi:hypothetical protein
VFFSLNSVPVNPARLHGTYWHVARPSVSKGRLSEDSGKIQSQSVGVMHESSVRRPHGRHAENPKSVRRRAVDVR